MWVGITYAGDKWRGRMKKKSRMKTHYLRLFVQPRWAASMTAAPAVESLRLDPIQHIYSFSSHWKLNLCILYRKARARAECESVLLKKTTKKPACFSQVVSKNNQRRLRAWSAAKKKPPIVFLLMHVSPVQSFQPLSSIHSKSFPQTFCSAPLNFHSTTPANLYIYT